MYDVEPSVDGTPILLEPGERSPFDKSTAAGMVGLMYLARQSYEEKRRKQCLEVTTAILKIDPAHEEARSIHEAVRSELQRDFASAQALAQEAQSRHDRALYGEAAAALRRIVDADADNVEAQNLLHRTIAASHSSGAVTELEHNSGRATGMRRSVIIGSVAFVVVAVVLALPNRTDSQISAPPATSKAPAVTVPSVIQAPVPLSQPVAVPEGIPLRAEILRTVEGQPVRPPMSPLAAAAVGVRPKPLVGDLAVSAAVPVEIYRGEENLGATPATLQLAAGPQTLEYRYQGLRQTVTHYIAPQATTTATISFSTKLQINARPWAQVFIEGARLTPIGQTPLGDVTVPIGSVLLFQNPGYPDKRYRVTVRDATIQVVFP